MLLISIDSRPSKLMKFDDVRDLTALFLYLFMIYLLTTPFLRRHKGINMKVKVI